MKTLTFFLFLLTVIGVHAQQYVGSDNPSVPLGDGTSLVFSGVANNTDPMWIRKHNVSNNVTELRVNIGDDPTSSFPDFFVVGGTTPDGWYPRFTVSASGTTTANGNAHVLGQLYAGQHISFKNHPNNKDFITGQYEPIIYSSTAGGTIPGGSSSLVLQAGGTTAGRHIFFRTSDKTRMMITDNGRVGVGTSTPYAMLHLSGETPWLAFSDTDVPHTSQNPHWIARASGSTGSFVIASTPDFSALNEHIIIYPDGRTAMNGLLSANKAIEFGAHIENTDFITAKYAPMIYSSRSGGSIPGGSSSLVLQSGGTSAGRHIFFRTLDATRMMITDQGKVGIGITSPHHELDVKGKIHSQEVIVDMNGWSDYVFDSTYVLPPLSEVEAYIKANKHLPEIPSEAEVKENGVAVGEMNALLLKKIEELTLYVIELNKKVADQQAQFTNLKN